MILGDDAAIARVLLRMGTSTQRVSLAELRAEVGRIRATYLSSTSLDDMDSSGFAEAFAGAANRFRIKLAPEYAILTKATATLEGIIRTWHPHIDLVAIARPVVERVVAGRWSPTRLLTDAMTGATDVGSLLRGLPIPLEQLLHDVESGNLQIRAVSPALDELPLPHPSARQPPVAHRLRRGAVDLRRAAGSAGAPHRLPRRPVRAVHPARRRRLDRAAVVARPRPRSAAAGDRAAEAAAPRVTSPHRWTSTVGRPRGPC